MATTERATAFRVHEDLAKRIEQGNLPANTLLSESELAKQMQISRTPIREALLMLESDGLVHRFPGRGYLVTEITPQDVDEIFELRLQLELLALRKAYPVLEPEQIDAQLDMLHSLTPESSADDYYETDRRLHNMIVQTCRNQRLQSFLRMLNSQIERVRYISARTPDRLKASRDEHLALVEALAARDLPLAEKRLTEHIRNVQASTKKVCYTHQMQRSSIWSESDHTLADRGEELPMKLTEEEEKMLHGEYGPSVQKSMQILTTLGNIYGAEHMIPVKSVHMPGSSIVVAGEAATSFVEQMGENDTKFAAFTTLNTGAMDMDRPEELGFSEETVSRQHRLTGAYERMGGVPCHTCTPYLIGHCPKYGEHVAWGESSAIAFANSVLGARTNREGGPAALAAAIAGRVPAYGYHLDENRRGQFLVHVNATLTDIADYGALGYWVGTRVESGVPVFTGIPKDVSNDQLKSLGAALASSGAVALFHIVGITPEAPTVEAAFGPNTPKQTWDFTDAEKEEAYQKLSKQQGQPVSLVAMGCPHSSINEIIRVAELVKGKNVKSAFWVLCAQPIKHLAERSGHAKILADAGVTLVCDTCPVLGAMAEPMQKIGMTAMATNSAKLAHYAPGQWKIPTYYGTTEQCVNAALKGEF